MKTTTKSAFHRGFTLIELMIVIVILGILMGTILPRLTGAQSRARDTARVADLNNIAQALEVYFNDRGSYPIADAGGCLVGTTAGALGEYLKGGRVPEPASKQQNTLGCIGTYYYKPLKRSAIPQSAYILASDVETWQTANYLATNLLSTQFASTTEYLSIAAKVGKDKVTSEAGDARLTIFVVIP